MSASEQQMGFSFLDPSETNEANEANVEEDIYEPLDYQLADLIIKSENISSENPEGIAQKKLEILKENTLAISKQTREGSIALKRTKQQQNDLQDCKTIFYVREKEARIGGLDNFKPLILDNGYLYLRRYWQYQKQLAELIRSHMQQTDLNDQQRQRLDFYFKDEVKDDLNNESDSGNTQTSAKTNWQQLAAQRALQNQFLIVSGGPGTGKTTTITRILALLIEEYLAANEPNNQPDSRKSAKKGGGGNKHDFKILLAAPTGKASIRMLDSIREAQQRMNLPEEILQYLPEQASTLHKLLGYIPDSIQFKHNRQNPLNADVILIDEASMIDIAMMSKLVEAVPVNAKLILIGDKDQLSSVETGSVFADMCRGLQQTPYMVTLQKNWRFSKDSGIGQLAIAANEANQKALFRVLNEQSQSECELISPSILRNKYIPEELLSAWQPYFDLINNPNASLDEIFQAFNQYRILCAQRRGLNGSVFISEKVETTLKKQGQIYIPKKHSNQSWYHGRPIMITQNNYEKGLFNGDTGITLIKNGKIQIYFPDGLEEADNRYKSFSPVRIPAHETTWAMTIHKSQGSEFDHVNLILPQEIMPLLTKQLIYTGITRAKKQIGIIASEDVLAAGIKAKAKKATRIETYL